MQAERSGQGADPDPLWQAVSALDAVIEADADGVVQAWNDRAEAVLGWSAADAVGSLTLAQLVDEQDQPTFDALASSDEAVAAQVALALVHHDGHRVAADVTIAAGAAAAEGRVLVVVRPHASPAAGSAAAGLLAPRATPDELLTAVDRSDVIATIDAALGREDRGDLELAVLAVALDPSTVGNLTTERTLTATLVREITSRMREAAGPAATIERLPDGRFAVVLDRLDAAHRAAGVADRIMDAFRPAGAGADDTVRTTVSLGIGFAGDVGASSGADVLEHAEDALTAALAEGGDRCIVFDEAISDELDERLRVREELYDSIDAGDFRLHYQPVVDFASGAITMVEALVRWEHPTRGLVAAGEFITLAEEHDLILPLGAWVLNEACGQCRTWVDELGERAPIIAVNLSAQQFLHPAAVAQITGVVSANDLDPGRLSIELSETTLMQDAEASIARLQELKEVGVRLSVDHFGSSSSSFSHLQRFPIDVVKIDRSFVDGIDRDPHHEAVATSIVHLARSQGFGVTAEGIETEEQRAAVEALGCDHGQGYLVGRPQPPDELAALLRG